MNTEGSPEVTVLLGVLMHKIKSTPSLELQLGELSLGIIGVLKVVLILKKKTTEKKTLRPNLGFIYFLPEPWYNVDPE